MAGSDVDSNVLTSQAVAITQFRDFSSDRSAFSIDLQIKICDEISIFTPIKTARFSQVNLKGGE